MSDLNQQAKAAVGVLRKLYTEHKNNYFRIGLSASMVFYATMGFMQVKAVLNSDNNNNGEVYRIHKQGKRV